MQRKEGKGQLSNSKLKDQWSTTKWVESLSLEIENSVFNVLEGGQS